MKPFISQMLPAFYSIHLQLLLFFTFNSPWFSVPNTTATVLGNQTDHLTLLKFKESISKDPYGILLSWNSSVQFCNWHGITCDRVHKRVTELNLQGYKLYGSISPHVGNLSFLRNLNLEANNFQGEIPQELGRLFRVQQLFLGNNSLTGEIPTTLTNCTHLNLLSLGWNKLIGNIPIQVDSLKRLQILRFPFNNLIKELPSSIGNLSSLNFLSVGYNNLEGHLPQEICRLNNLTFLGLGPNKLSGKFPSCVYNMSSLTVFAITDNQFHGSLPSNLFHTLPNIQVFYIGLNPFSGHIPNSLTNASFLKEFDISQCQFVGKVPNLGKLQHLVRLALDINNLGNNSTTDLEFLISLTNSSNLQLLTMPDNNFGGSLSNSLGNLSTQLRLLDLGSNQIFGKIPASLGNLNSLIALLFNDNNFDGIVPMTFVKFQKLQSLDLSFNKLWGDIPAFIGNLTQLFRLDLAQNTFEGTIPPSIGSCQMLQYLDLSQNNLRGTIPSEVFSLTSTIELNLSGNSLSGSLLEEVGRLKNTDMIDVSKNLLSGAIPKTIGECTILEYLHLNGNSFQGIIPSSLASLKGLRTLDLSQNNLSGSIPRDLQNIFVLEYLNVSFNMLEGMVPTEGVFKNMSELSMTGNKRLCGGVTKLHLPPCPVEGKKPTNHHNFRLIGVIIGVVACVSILSIILIFYWMRRTRNKMSSSVTPTINQLPKVSYKDLHHATNGFLTRNVIGSGSVGFVYRGTLVSDDRVVAIKVLNLEKKGAHKSFVAECNALKNIRHRNLVTILTCCSSIDNKGQEFKALVFEYVTNGSLEQWLHPRIANIEEHPRILDLNQRLNIIIDVASALHYLHFECEQQIVHCDLKPSNVLLDDDMVAHVSDFGLARLLSVISGGTSHKHTSTTGIKGTIGYAPPEYGMSPEVSIHGDMYSFGILILEMLTGRRPTDEMFEEGQNLHSFVKASFPHNPLHILDPSLVPRNEATIEEANLGNLDPNVKKCLVSLLRIGLACSVDSPTERMNTMDVSRELNVIKRAFAIVESQYYNGNELEFLSCVRSWSVVQNQR